MPSRCPECNFPVEPDALACVNCPASWEEEGEDYRRPDRSHRFVSGPVVWIAMLGAFIFVAWFSVVKFLQYIDPENAISPMKGFIDKRVNELDPMVARATKGGGPNTWGAPTGSIYGNAASKADAAEADDGSPTDWRLRGRVLDLTTMQPVAKASMIFEDAKSGKKRESSTDASGAYRVSVPPLEGRGYTVRIAAAGYAASYLNPGAENVDKMSAEDRRSLASDIAHSADGPYTVQALNSDPLVTDFYLAPAK